MKKENKIPKILYKYRDLTNQYHLNTILKGEIYLANPFSFNDPFEGGNRTRWDKLNYEDCLVKNEEMFLTIVKNLSESDKKKKIKELTDSKEFWHPDNLQVESQLKLNEWDERIGLYCLSTCPKNILMWSHYADNHEGFVIGFNTNKLLLDNKFDYLKAVEYTQGFPEISGLDDLGLQFEKKFFYKSNLWSYENEWRLSKNHIENRIVKIESTSIQEVIFGCKAKDKLISDTLKKVNDLYNNVDCFQAEIKDGCFELTLREID